MIPYGRQSIDADDVAAVVAVLEGDWLTQGPAVPAFEAALATLVGSRHAVAFSSGTAGLHAAAAATGLGPGHVVATSPLSFVASANCARYVGADVSFVDIDASTLNLDPAAVPASLDAVVVVHYAGLPCDLSALAERPRIVIEDAAHALGAETPDGPVGNCVRSDACVFSFHPVKAVTTGEGGAVTTNDDGIAERLRMFRSHGTVRRPERGGWAYDVVAPGYNYRLTDIQAALGTSQLGKLGAFMARRRELAARYRELLAGLPLELPPDAPPGFDHAYHLFPIRVEERHRVYDELHARNIRVQVHYPLIPDHPLFGGSSKAYPKAAAAYERLLSLPLFPGLSEQAQDTVVDALRMSL